jgi:hypothetical protein
MNDGRTLILRTNLDEHPVKLAPQALGERDQLLFESHGSAAAALASGYLQPFTTIATMMHSS